MPKVDLREMHSVASWPEPRVEPWQLRALLRVVRAARAFDAECCCTAVRDEVVRELSAALYDIEDEKQ